MVKAHDERRAYIAWIGNLDEVMCYEEERVVHLDNTVSYNGLKLQIEKSEYRHHYVRATVIVKEYLHGRIAIFHGPLLIGTYNRLGQKLAKKAA